MVGWDGDKRPDDFYIETNALFILGFDLPLGNKGIFILKLFAVSAELSNGISNTEADTTFPLLKHLSLKLGLLTLLENSFWCHYLLSKVLD